MSNSWKGLRIAGTVVAAFVACTPTAADRAPTADTGRVPVIDSGFAAVAESAWVDVSGVTMIGFYPIATNEQL